MNDDLESQDRTGAPTQTALSLREAAELVGKDRTTLQKALKRKGISTYQDESGKHWIEPSELFRVYPHAQHAHARSGEKSQESTLLHSGVHTLHEGGVHATAEVGRLRELRDELAREREERGRERQQLKEHLDDLRRRLEASEEERRMKDTQLMALLTDQREKTEKERQAAEAAAARPRGFLAWLRGR